MSPLPRLYTSSCRPATCYDFGMSLDKWRVFGKQPEGVRGAVIRYRGENFEGKNHAMAMDRIRERFADYEPGQEEARGWLTTRDRIISEAEAQEIEHAREAATGQESPLAQDAESSLFRKKNE